MTTEPLPALPTAELRKHYRKRMGLSRQQTADQLGVSSRQILRWENGGTPNPHNHRNYAALLQEWAGKINNT
jgi:transcriptional regulator with XRE-family HTH domain